MALSLNYPSPFGGEAFTYFIVGEVRENRYYNHAVVTLYGFVNPAVRQTQASYIPVEVTIGPQNWIKDATIAQIYGFIKQTPEFADAEDA